MAKSPLVKTTKAIADTATTGYKAIETTVVDSYTKIEDTFVERYLQRDDETLAQAKERLKNQH